MTATTYVHNWQRNPSIAAVVKATFPSYKRKKVAITRCDGVTMHDVNWSGGTKYEYVSYDTHAKTVHSLSDDGPAPWNNPTEGQRLPVLPRFLIVSAGHFCGKPSILTIYAHPEVTPWYSPAANDTDEYWSDL